ncbi:GAF domain protein [Aeromicrobium marinum DSM 15272]|uniref:GAF domain protein n=1 Tax=Aeromicrobium marinum DSM 15272 TaxID=585531 RepID=E2S9Y4_9ACTN|nr:GAF domain-containing protein [Aeromicrobium marinum]EFQ84058.1 GAF domain protein [Aeromicrobium marinum DSM 15272]
MTSGEEHDAAVEDLVSQSRLRDLIRVNHAVTSHLDLDTVLRRIVEMATELIDARYAAMGVIGDDGGLEQFIHVGMDEPTAEQIGHLPAGKGLLGALIDDPRPVRIPRIAADVRSSGFPAHHPPMDSFLGVPIRVRSEVYGNLYLTDSRSGAFTADDESLAEGLAATAGIAIANARQFEESQHREKWSLALADATRDLLSDDDGDPVMQLLQTVLDLAEADTVSIHRRDEQTGSLVVDLALGEGAAALQGSRHDAAGHPVAEAISSRRARIHDGGGLMAHSALIAPFVGSDHPGAALVVSRCATKGAFRPRDLTMVSSFASHVGVALDRTEARRNRRRVSMLEDRSRIARDLHDHVIQRLFATGLSLQATASGLDPGTAARITDHVQEIDGAITQIRQSIFAMSQDVERAASSPRGRILAVVNRLGDHMGRRPTVAFDGPIDLLTDPDLARDVEAVIGEALTNAVKHAQASAIDIEVAIAGSQIQVTVADDGVGLGSSPRRSGLANLEDRATARGGGLRIVSGGAGTTIIWTASL